MEEKERLTDKNKLGAFASLKDKAISQVGAFKDYETFYAVQIATNKLWEYEQTNLSPKEVEQLKKENKELRESQNKLAIEKLEELYKCFNEMNQNTEYESFIMNRKFALHKIDTMIAELRGGKDE